MLLDPLFTASSARRFSPTLAEARQDALVSARPIPASVHETRTLRKALALTAAFVTSRHCPRSMEALEDELLLIWSDACNLQ